MKKTYIIPETLVVELSARTSILQASLPISDDETITGSGEILTKEDKSSGPDVWDEEW